MEAAERILEDVVGYIYASGLAVIARGPKVDAGKDAGFLHLFKGFGEARERAAHSGQCSGIGIYGERSSVAKEVRKHRGR